MAILSDTQRVLLSTASQRHDGSVLPLPDSIKAGGGLSKSLAALISRGFVEERETDEPLQAVRADGDINYGVFITAAGSLSIGVEPTKPVSDAEVDTAIPACVTSDGDAATKAATKATLVLALLSRSDGATMAELIELTSWLPHTTRAALTGLRKKGHDVVRGKRDSVTCYRIANKA